MAGDVSDAPVITMRGAGYYSDNTVGAKAVIEAAGEHVAEALSAMNLAAMNLAAMDLAAAEQPFAIADMGAADGGTSLDLIRRTVATVRAASPSRPITVTYTDLPFNDFSVLFRRLHGLLGDAATAAPLGEEPGVFTFASGTSFYRQIFPDNTLSLGFSATAMHWLSTGAGPIVDHVQAVGASPDERASYRRQAKVDWETILLARARELVPGGRLVLANFCEDEGGRYLGGTGGVDMFDTFAKHWRALARAGTITEAEYRAGTLQQFYKTVDDFTAPFADADTPVRRAGLRLERVSTRVTGCPYAADFRRHGDAAAFAKAYIPTLRSWTESTFFSALSSGRTLVERQGIVDRFYASYEADVAAAPAGHAMDYVHCFMTIAKVG